MGPSVRRLYEQGKSVNGAGINCSFAVQQVTLLLLCLLVWSCPQTDGLAYRQTVWPTDSRRMLRTSAISCSSVVEPDMMPCGVLVFARWSCLQTDGLAYRQTVWPTDRQSGLQTAGGFQGHVGCHAAVLSNLTQC